MPRSDRGQQHVKLEDRRAEALRAVRRQLATRRPLVPSDEDRPLAGFERERLGRRADEGAGISAALWHARYTEWAVALDWLRNASGGQSQRLDSVELHGLGDLQAFSKIDVHDGLGRLLSSPERDRELVTRVVAALHKAAVSEENVPAQLWRDYVLEGFSAEDAAARAAGRDRPTSGDRRGFDRWTWRGGLGAPDAYPARKEKHLRNLLRCLERSLEQPTNTLAKGGLPPALVTNRIGGPLVGRAAELDALVREWEAARHGGNRVVLISGPAGIGKSELSYEFARMVCSSAAVVASRPSLSGTRAHAEVADLARQLIHLEGSTSALGAVGEAERRSLRRLLPEEIGGENVHGELANPAGDLTALHEAIAGLLRRASSREPIVVVIEDLHAATPGSFGIVCDLVEQRIPGVLFLLSYRLGEPESRPVEQLAEVARQTGPFQRLEPGEFAEADLVQLVEELDPGDRMVGLGPSLYRKTRGHPFFTISLLRSIMRDDLAAPWAQLDGANVPVEIDDHIAWRLSRLSLRSQQALQMASVIGYDIEIDLLASSLDQTLDDTVTSAVMELEEASLLDCTDECPGFVRFPHELVRDAIYEKLPLLDRARRHRAVALAIREAYTPELVTAYAHHCYQAAMTYADMRSRSVDASMEAARDSIVRMAYGEAVSHYRRALEHTHSGEQRTRLKAGLGDALWRAGDLSEARQQLEQATVAAREQDSSELLAQIATTLAAVAYQSNTSDPELRALYQEALDRLPQEEVFWRVRLLTAIGRETSPLLAPQVLPQIADLTLKLAYKDDDPATRAYGYFIQHDALLSQLDAAGRVRVAEKMADEAETANDPYLLCASNGHQVNAALELLAATAVRDAIDACEQTAERFRYPYARWQAALYRGGSALFQKPLAEAEDAIEHARTIGEPLGYGEVELMYLVQFSFLYRELGRIEETEPIVRQGAAQYELMAWKAGLACGLCERGRGQEATPLLQEFERIGLNHLPRDGTYPLTLSFLAQAYTYRRDRRRASQLLPIVRACVRRHPVASGSATYWGSMEYHLGLLHATLGHYTDAISCFNAAYALDQQMQAPLWECHTLIAHAQTLQARNHPGDQWTASRREDEARDIARRFAYRRAEMELNGVSPTHIPR